MRTYEIAIEVRYTERVTVEVPEGTDSAELLRIGVEKAGLQNLPEHATSLYYARDTTQKPKTDKQRFNDAFRELRKIGFSAKQNLSAYDTGVDVSTQRDDTNWAFRGTKLHGLMPVSWAFEGLTQAQQKAKVKAICEVFERHGFDTEWEGMYWNAIEIRGGK